MPIIVKAATTAVKWQKNIVNNSSSLLSLFDLDDLPLSDFLDVCCNYGGLNTTQVVEGGYKLFGLAQNFTIDKKIHNFDPIQLIF